MKFFFGLGNSLRSRIIIFCSALLMAVQGIAFLIMNHTSLVAAEQRAQQELEAGEQVLRRLLAYRKEQLVNASVVLTADFGFRRAAATADRETIRSALNNHGNRIGADLMMLVSTDGLVLADSRIQTPGALPQVLEPLLDQAKGDGRATGTIIENGHLLQVTVLPVLAPDVVAWVVLGFDVADFFVEELRALTNLDLTFVKVSEEGPESIASTLPNKELQVVLKDFSLDSTLNAISNAPLRSHDTYIYRTVQLTQSGDTRGIAVLQRAISDTFQYLNELRQGLAALAVLSIVISIVGIALIANTVTRPLRTLATVAEKIKQGDYGSAANFAEKGEIGMLAESFNVMRDSISTLLRLAYRDPLTTLPNRAMFNDRIDQAIKLAQRRQENFSLLFIDLDRFKDINDTFGHAAGDIVLKEVSRKLRESVRETDTVARLGGDEFAIILLADDERVIETILFKIDNRIAGEKIDIGPQTVEVGCSIGVAQYPQHGLAAKELMRHADLNMYKVKQERREQERDLNEREQ